MDFVFDAVRMCRAALPADTPLLGFAGAPFTLASYAIEGGGSKNYTAVKQMMFNDFGAWRTLMDRLVDSLIGYLQAQLAAGCQAVQIFDSWAGCLSPADYREYVLPFSKRLIDAVSVQGPVIHFLTGNPALLALQAEAGGTVIGIDWRCSLADVRRSLGPNRAVQGNLDPNALFADLATLRRKAQEILTAGAGPGHIFNLGHGVLPGTPEESVKALVHMVGELSARR